MKERLKNLYQNKELAPQRLLSAVAKGWLTVTDVVEIVGEDNATAVILNAKVAEISAACNAAIEAGEPNFLSRLFAKTESPAIRNIQISWNPAPPKNAGV